MSMIESRVYGHVVETDRGQMEEKWEIVLSNPNLRLILLL